MSGEALAVVVGKWAWVTIFPYLFWLHKKDKTKLDNTYTKKETSELIDLKVEPIRQECNGITNSLHDKFDTLLDLVKSNNDQNTAQRSENNSMLHEIKTEVAVIKNDIKHITENHNDN